MYIEALQYAVHAFRDVINLDTKNILKSMEKHHVLPITWKTWRPKMEDCWFLSSAHCTTIFPKLLTGINVRNRFAYVSNIWDKMFP